MTKRMAVAVLLIVTLMLCACRHDPSLPVYKMINDMENDEDACVIVNDIEYRMRPELKWHLNIGEPIGYTGNAKNEVLNVLGDTKMNFILISHPGFWDGSKFQILCRTDYEIPQPSAESVTKIVSNGSDNLNYTITDKEIISQLFEALASDERDFNAINMNTLESA